MFLFCSNYDKLGIAQTTKPAIQESAYERKERGFGFDEQNRNWN